jgi:hypothetical protein
MASTAGAAVREALEQIDDKGYLIPYSVSGKKLVKVGAVFDAQSRLLQKKQKMYLSLLT